MHVGHVCGKSHGATRCTRAARIYPTAHLNTVNQEEDFRLDPHRLHDVQKNIEPDKVSVFVWSRLGYVLRAQADRHLAADVGAVSRGAARRNLKPDVV